MHTEDRRWWCELLRGDAVEERRRWYGLLRGVAWNDLVGGYDELELCLAWADAKACGRPDPDESPDTLPHSLSLSWSTLSPMGSRYVHV